MCDRIPRPWHTSGRGPPRARTRERLPRRARLPDRPSNGTCHAPANWPLGPANEKSPLTGAFMDALRFLQNLDLRRLRTLRAHRRHEADALILFQRLEAIGLDFREVREQILAARFRSDEAITFFRVEPLNDAGFHTVFPRN